jgi:hypothetical protein
LSLECTSVPTLLFLFFHSIPWTNFVRTFQGLLRSSTDTSPFKQNSSSTCMLVLTHTVRQHFLYTAVLTVSVLCLSLFCYIYISLLLLCVDITVGTASLTSIIRARLRTFSEKEKRKKERKKERKNETNAESTEYSVSGI